MDGIGCNKQNVNDIFCILNDSEILEMKKVFESTTSNMNDRVRSEISGSHKRLIEYLLVNGRSEAPVHHQVTTTLARELHSVITQNSTMLGGISSKGEERVIEIFTSISRSQLQAISVSMPIKNITTHRI